MPLRRPHFMRAHHLRFAGAMLVALVTLALAPALASASLRQMELTEPTPAAYDTFGAAIAADGDYAVIGAPWLATDDDQYGAADVFMRSNGTWSLQQALPPTGDPNDEFGTSMAISGDTAVVGAYRSDVSTSGGLHRGQGEVFVYVRSDQTWTQQAELTASHGAANDWFGYSVAIDGDTLLVGAPDHTANGKTREGAAYVFTRDSNGIWTQATEIDEAGGAVDDLFGYAVALSGGTALVGAPADYPAIPPEATGSGAAYVFTGSGATWTQQGTLTPSDATTWDWYGSAVALSGDTAVVGAANRTVGANDAQGKAFVFTRAAGAWSEQQALVTSDGAAGDEFGASVATTGDTVLVGAPHRTSGGNSMQGGAYAFHRSGALWTQGTDALVASDGAAGDEFGWAVALAGATPLVGAPLHSVTTLDAAGTVSALQQPQITASVSGDHGTISPSAVQTLGFCDTPTFTFTPDPHYHIASVTVDGATTNMTGPNAYTFPAVSADHSISVGFAIDTYTITPAVSGGHGSIGPGTPQTVAYGATPTFGFTPDPGYYLASVTVDGTGVTPVSGAYTFSAVAADHRLAATFAAKFKPSVGRPTCPKKVRRGKRFAVRGSFKPLPAGASAQITITAYRRVGHAWKAGRSWAATTGAASSSGRYSAKAFVTKTGAYRFTASIAATAKSLAAVSPPSRKTTAT